MSSPDVKKDQKHENALFELLSVFESGSLTITANGLPMLKVDAQSRSVDVEAAGVKECGIKLSKIVKAEESGGVFGMLKRSESMARGLSERGWRFVLYDRGSKLLTMGRGVSRLTGRIQANPLKLRRIIDSL
ncbi:MAG: hypothetical protein ACREBS_11220 [Nitrososphaerales archaeon]